MVKMKIIGQSAAKYLYMRKLTKYYISRKKLIFDSFIKDRGSTTIISNPTSKYKDLCYLED